MGNTVITIARSYGSGGRTLGKLLAKELGINYYDRELIRMASDESGINEALFGEVDEKLKKSPLFRIVKKTYRGEIIPPESGEFVSDDNLFNYQAKVIRQLAEEESCVIIGRCADYALEERDDVLSVFIHADLEDRIKNVAKLNELTDNKAKELIHKTDKRRASYYNYYTNKKWGDAESYDICINSSKFGVDGCVKAIKDFLELEASLEE